MIRHSVMVGWADGPLKRYVDDARLQFTVLMHRSGQVLAQHGFQSRMDVQTACALSAAINATADSLATMIDGAPFRRLHYAGAARQMHLAQPHVVGLADELHAALAASAPADEDAPPALAEDFERDLNTNLAALFGKR